MTCLLGSLLGSTNSTNTIGDVASLAVTGAVSSVESAIGGLGTRLQSDDVVPAPTSGAARSAWVITLGGQSVDLYPLANSVLSDLAT